MTISKKNHFFAIFLIILLGFGVYANSLSNGFVYDDELAVKNNSFIASWSNLGYFFSPLYFVGSGESSYRPAVTLSYFFDYSLWGGNPTGYHLTNIVLHIFNSILFYFFLLHTLPLIDKELLSSPKRGLLNIPFLSAIFFICHPVQTEAIDGIGFRHDILAGLFCFSALIFYLKTKSVPGRKKFFYYFSSLFCFFLALLSKETAIILPLIILLIDVMSRANIREMKQGVLHLLSLRLKTYSGYFAVLISYCFIRFIWMVSPQMPLGAMAGIGYPGGSLYTALLTMSRIFTSYLGLLFFPFSLYSERYFRYMADPSYSLLEPRVLFSFAVLALVIILVIRSFRRHRIFTFCGLWFLIFLLPVANIIPLNHPMAERFLYIPSAGFCLFLAVLIIKIFHAEIKHISSGLIRKITILITILTLSSYSLRTVIHNRVWKDDLTFWSAVVRHPPASARAYSYLGFAYFRKDMYDKAIELHQKAIKVTPFYEDAYNGLGMAYIEKKMYSKAIKAYEKVLDVNPNNAHAHIYNNLGRVYLKRQEYGKAEAEFKKAIELNPFHFRAHNNLGIVYFQQGNYGKAIRNYKKALLLASENASIYNNLGLAYIKKGDLSSAEESWQKALKIDPDNLTAKQNLRNLNN